MEPKDFYGNATVYSKDDIARAAFRIGCEPAVIAAVIDVEASGAGYLTDGRPKILFEAHIFGRLTNNRYDSIRDSRGNAISSKSWDRSLYGSAGAWQYDRLFLAMKYNETAALKACSWGAFQILGDNYKICGYNNVQEFVLANVRSAGEQLDCFVRFVRGRNLDDELRSQSWSEFARVYNGPSYKKNAYDTKLATAFAKRYAEWRGAVIGKQTTTIQIEPAMSSIAGTTIPLTRDKVAQVQAALNALFVVTPALQVDGWWGPKTEGAIRKYQELVDLPQTGTIDEATYNRLVA